MKHQFKNDQFESHAKRYHSFYINHFISMNCAADMLQEDLFPNAKEITESFGAFEATRYLPYEWGDPNINVVVVGDGATPRTAATFAFRTKWSCFSVDPNMRMVCRKIHRLQYIDCKVEELNWEFAYPTIIVHVHSHATIKNSLRHIRAPQRDLISIPCCVKDNFRTPDVQYRDENIWSPENLVNIYRNV